MIVPIVLFLISLAGIAAALALPGMAGLLLVAGPSALASLYLVARARLARPGPLRRRGPEPRLAPRRAKASSAPERQIVIDGSNAMHWKDGTPKIETLREILDRLDDMGFTPGVVFDANAGYKLTGRYLNNVALGQILDLPADNVIVVGKGTPADTTILEAARFLGARILTNDRYSEWAGAHPELLAAGHLIRGGYRDGKLWLELDSAGDQRRAARAE